MSETSQQAPHALLAQVAACLREEREAIIDSGKAAFDAADPSQAHHAAARLEAIATAEQCMWQLSDLLAAAGIPATGAALPPPAPAPPHVPGTRRGGPRLPDGPAHSHTYYREPVLRVLRAAGRPLSLAQLWGAIEREVGRELNTCDLAMMPNHGKLRWQYVVQWTLTALKREGRVDNPNRGFWRLK